ncbi:MAG TPA: cytochrome c biogenesis protein CcdA [Phycisphaerales bacterium]|nr:cytochrome c biogenesis protein CcdA [Phycisphaerales bacterium]
MMISLRRILPILVLALTASSAVGQIPRFEPPGRSASESTRVNARIVIYEGAAVPGREVTIGVLLDIQNGWKIQAGEDSGDYVPPYIPTTVALTVPSGWQAGRVLWPKAKTFTMGEGEFAESLAGYEGRIIIAVPVLVPEDAQPGEVTIRANIGYQACDANLCEMPTSAEARTRITVIEEGAAVETPALDEAIAMLFVEPLSRRGDALAPVRGDSTAAAPDTAPRDTAPPAAPRPTFFGIPLPDTTGPFGLLILAVLSALGGFILNLTPCVLPVIPIKVMTILQHANKPGKNLVLGLWMAFGVVAFWVALGLPVAFLTGVTDPSRLFGIWWFTLGIGVLIALMGIGIMGLFTIQLPQSVYAVNPKADTAWGSFLFGVMTAILGLPCFGFVAGALLAGSATMPPSWIMTIFTSLGVGMAVPYLVLSAKPSLVESLPRTGPASELVKQVMGLLLLAAAAYFVGSGLIGLVNERPYMARQLHWWSVGVFAGLAGLWLIIRTFQITPNIKPRIAFLLIGMVMTSLALLYAADSTAKARGDWELRQAAIDAAGGAAYLTGVWNDYTPVTFQKARDDGRIVVLDFTAEWCINCKVLKSTVLNRDPVSSHLAKSDVVKFTVDLTSTTAPGWDFLRELGQTGIPLLVIYTPGSDVPWQANNYTPQQVVAAIEQARASAVASAAGPSPGDLHTSRR